MTYIYKNGPDNSLICIAFTLLLYWNYIYCFFGDAPVFMGQKEKSFTIG
jgi:hypothetical protein